MGPVIGLVEDRVEFSRFPPGQEVPSEGLVQAAAGASQGVRPVRPMSEPPWVVI